MESKEQSITEQHEEEVAEAEERGEAEEGEGEEEAGEDEDEEQEGIQPGQLSHREHEEDEEGQQEVEGDQEIVDDEKENQQVDEGARVKKKSDLDILLEKQSMERQRNRKKKGDSERVERNGQCHLGHDNGDEASRNCKCRPVELVFFWEIGGLISNNLFLGWQNNQRKVHARAQETEAAFRPWWHYSRSNLDFSFKLNNPRNVHSS